MIGRSFGNYQVVRALGEGGMGTVYLATHPMIGKQVAVKVLRPELGANQEVLSRFFQEARSVNEIRHPNIVDISDFGQTPEGDVYLIMELLEGKTLRDELKTGGALAPERATSIVRQVADALQAAHGKGIIHRDLKPDNIFLVVGGTSPGVERVKLLDFGVAKLLGDKQAGHKTQAGSVLGSPFYMAPEQVLGKEVDARSDVYALGVVLFETVTGQVPFPGTQLIHVLQAVIATPPPAPSSIKPGVSPALDRFIDRCLAKDPPARPASMTEFLAGLPRLADAAMLSVPVTPTPVAQQIGLGATMIAGVNTASLPGLGVPPSAPRPSGAPGAALAAGSTTRSMNMTAHGAALRGTMAGGHAAVSALRAGVARAPVPSGPAALLARAVEFFRGEQGRKWLVPGIAGAVVLVGSAVWLLSGPDTPPPPPQASAPEPPRPALAIFVLDSDPPRALVERLADGRVIGTTPIRLQHLADGQVVKYMVRLDGHMPQQIALPATEGEHPVTVRLDAAAAPARPVASRPVAVTRSRRRPPAKAKARPAARAPAAVARTAAPAPRPAATAPMPAARPSVQSTTQYPLLDPTPVRRLGGRR